MTIEDFIVAAKQVHGSRYSYGQAIYTRMKDPILIGCSQHGLFSQTPYQHLIRGSNCPRCSYAQRAASRKQSGNWLTFEEARGVVRAQQLNNISMWNAWCKANKPTNVPSSPRTTYRSQWKGWSDWLGTERVWLDFREARAVVRTFNLRSYEDWVFFCNTLQKKPQDIPFEPKKIYKDQWKGWSDWLGYTSRANGDLPGIIYILRQSNLPPDVVKVGRTYRLDKRMYEHKRIQNTTLSIIHTFDVSNMREAEIIAHRVARECGVPYSHYNHKEYFRILDVPAFVYALDHTMIKNSHN